MSSCQGSKTLQAVQVDLSIISSLVDSTLHSPDDSLRPAANWVLKSLDVRGSLDEKDETKATSADIKSFQSSVGNSIVSKPKNNILFIFLFKTSYIHSAFLILRKFPALNLNMQYIEKIQSKNSVVTMEWTNQLRHLEGKHSSKPALMSADVSTEWKTLRHYMTKQVKMTWGHNCTSWLPTLCYNVSKLNHFGTYLTFTIGTA